jgi:hypothetical protein
MGGARRGHGPEEADERRDPVREVALQAEVGQRTLGATDLARSSRELVAWHARQLRRQGPTGARTEFDEEHPEPPLLVRREDDDAREVVPVVRDLFLWKEALVVWWAA